MTPTLACGEAARYPDVVGHDLIPDGRFIELSSFSAVTQQGAQP